MGLIESVIINYIIIAMGTMLGAVFFAQVLYRLDINPKQYVLFVGIAMFLVGTAVSLQQFYGVNVKAIITLLCIVIFYRLILRLGLVKCLISAGIYIIILSVGNIVAVLAFALNGINYKSSLKDAVCVILAQFIIYFVVGIIITAMKLFKVSTQIPCHIRRKTCIINIGYIFLTVCLIAFNLTYLRVNNPLDVLMLTINMLLMLGYFVFSIYNTNNFLSLELKKEELEYQFFYNKTLNVIMQDLRRFKHDNDNVFAAVDGYIKCKQWEQLERYMDEVISETHRCNASMENMMALGIKNAGILGVISTKMEYAKNKNVNFKITVPNEVNEINFKISELCEIIGILLDNAIEAASESDEKKVDLLVFSENGILNFRVQNSLKGQVDIRGIFREGTSTKGEGRGNGLYIVSRIINKHDNVVLNTSQGQGIFKQELMIS